MDIRHILSTSPPIVENIFKHLSARDLCSCTQVCSFWKSMAEIEKNRRKDIFWFFKVGSSDEYGQSLNSPCSSPCIHALTPAYRVETELRSQMAQNRMQPAFCMAFVTGQLLETFDDFFPSLKPTLPHFKKLRMSEYVKKRKFLKTAMKVALQPFLPSQCPVTFTVAPGVIGCLTNHVPLEIEDGAAISGFLLPKFDGVDIHHFPVSEKYSKIAELVAEKSPIKCLLIFVGIRGISFTNKLVHSCLSKEDCQVAIGGAIVERTESLLGSIVAFCGPNVEAASVIVNSREQKELVQKKLETFQESGLLKYKCFAYMFACVGRGFYLYRERHVECSIFHKMFPNVPLVGIFGNGEIGVNYAPHLQADSKVLEFGKLKRYMKKFLHSNTTVFVLIAIKS